MKSDIVVVLFVFLFQVLYDVLLIEGKVRNLKRFIQTHIDIWIPVPYDAETCIGNATSDTYFDMTGKER